MQIGEIDWNSILNKVTESLPDIAKTYYGYRAIKAQSDAAVAGLAAPNYGLPMPGYYYSVSGNDAGPYSEAYVSRKGKSDTLGLLLLAGAGAVLLMLLFKDK